MKAVIILDSEFNSTHPMEAVLERRGFAVLRAGTTADAINMLKPAAAPVDLVIVEAPLSGSVSQTEAAGRPRPAIESGNKTSAFPEFELSVTGGRESLRMVLLDPFTSNWLQKITNLW